MIRMCLAAAMVSKASHALRTRVSSWVLTGLISRCPLQDLLEQISRQRFLFLGIITLALIAIWIFAWIFTGKLLDPIEANRLRQNQFIGQNNSTLRRCRPRHF